MASSETQPIKTLEELWSWKPEAFGEPCSSMKPRSAAYHITKSELNNNKIYDLVKLSDQTVRPKVLVCHDMKGGYIEDRFNGGCYQLTEEPYRFVHWALIDTFVYFSHHLITIPPRGWTQAAHKHGVEMLGTIITEFDEGKRICDELLKTRKTIDEFVKICCSIARAHHFEGWLLNIENKLDPEQVCNMVYLVEKLTQEMHNLVGLDSKVIWYDSVTDEGKLDWQNALNEKNVKYFNSCGGIYLNYGWRIKPDVNDLDNTVEFLEEHYGHIDRIRDIYVGIDVFGRGCYGGGGFASDEALKQILVERKNRKLSIAIFAPGWTHETKPKPQDQCDKIFHGNRVGCFAERENKFWKLLEEFLHFRGIKLNTKDTKEDSGPLFETSFNSGSGLITDGVSTSSDGDNGNDLQKYTWFLNLEMQDCLPVLFSHPLPILHCNAPNDTFKKIGEAFNMYLSGDTFEFLCDSKSCENIAPDKQQSQPDQLLVVENAQDHNNWTFSNQSCAVPIFINEITTENLKLLFVIDCKVIPKLEDRKSNMESKTISCLPHLIVKYNATKTETIEKVIKLCPYLNDKKCCFNKSYHHHADDGQDDWALKTLNEYTAKLSLNKTNAFDQIQYILNLESIRTTNSSSAVIISALLIEVPPDNQRLCIKKFVIY